MIALCNGTVEEAQGSDSSLISAGRMLALPPDREAVSARNGRAREGTSISIPPCPCIATRCEPRRPRGPVPLQSAPCWRLSIGLVRAGTEHLSRGFHYSCQTSIKLLTIQ